MERNALAPDARRQLHLHRHERPQRGVPRRRRPRARLRPRAAALRSRDPRPARAAARDPRADPLLRRRDDTSPAHVYLGETAAARLRAATCGAAQSAAQFRHGSRRRGTIGRMTLEFTERIARIPVYPAAGGYAQQEPLVRLASNESPYPPLPAVREAIERALSTLNRYPDPTNSVSARACPTATACPPRGSRSATAPATSCSRPARRCSSPAPSSSTRGRRSRSTRTSPPPPARAR